MTLRSRVRQAAFRSIGGTALVLIYHRVALLERDPQALAVAPVRFDAHMAVLSDTCRVVPLTGLLEDLRRRRVADRSVAVTFDDGYADNLLAAEPVLRARKVPATVFVSSGAIGSGREFWWDELERLLLGDATPSDEIEMAVGDARFHASLGHAEDEDAADWDVMRPDGSGRQRLYRDLCEFLRPLNIQDREVVLARLREASGVTAAVRGSHRPLTASEVAELDRSPVVDVGGHTVSHPVLSALPAAEQRSEIERDRAALENVLGHPPRIFSYPYGTHADYTTESVEIVRQSGYVGACANHPGVVKPWTDPFTLPRVIVRDWDEGTFADTIEEWFRAPR